MIRNHVKEAGLAAVHCAMRDLAPTARKHLAHKAECHGKEFPFIYRCYTVTEIPDRHTEGGDAVVSQFTLTTAFAPANLVPTHSVEKVRFYLRLSARLWQHTTISSVKLSRSLRSDPIPTSSFMHQLVLTLSVQPQYVHR